jgi:hypothetical protein
VVYEPPLALSSMLHENRQRAESFGADAERYDGIVRIEEIADPGAGRRYAGIGSRETPPAALALIEGVSGGLARRGWVLRTGMSPGADQAFYRGARAEGGAVELYLPWPGFEADARLGGEGAEVRELSRPSAGAYELAERHHPAWGRVGARARHLLARDGHQVLGGDLATAVAFVVCWTADGSLDGAGPRDRPGASDRAL